MLYCMSLPTFSSQSRSPHFILCFSVLFLGAACGSPYIVFIFHQSYGFMLQIYVIVIVRFVCDMVQTQHESRGREAPEGECCVCTISHTKRTITIIFSVTMAP